LAIAADEQPLWDRVKGWEIRVDTTIGNGCFAMTSYDEGTVMRIGVNPENDKGYLILGNDKWKSLEAGKDYNIKLKFDDETPWEGSARGVLMGDVGVAFLWVDFDDSNLFKEFMRKNVIQVFYNRKKVTSLSLAGSHAATVAVVECQNAMQTITPAPSYEKDPFASGVRYKTDPFAH